MTLFENLGKLSRASGVSGREEEVRNLMSKLMEPLVDDIVVDNMENLIAIKKGKESAPKVMLSAHMDEVGLMVKTISKDGFIRFVKLGRIDDRILFSQKVEVHTSKGVLKGIIASKPPQIQKAEERGKIITYDELFIDIGVDSRESAFAMGVNVGDTISFEPTFAKIIEDKVIGKALDNRVGCAVMIDVLSQIEKTDCTVYAVGTVQEEVGLRGAGIAAYKINPDFAIVLDVIWACDVPGVREFDATVKIGKGPVLPIADSGLITPPKMLRMIIESANDHKIPIQLETGWGGATDAAQISLSRQGVLCAELIVPERYFHSPTSMISLEDVENCAKLAALAVQKIQEVF